jgi:hypothetical protein
LEEGAKKATKAVGENHLNAIGQEKINSKA